MKNLVLQLLILILLSISLQAQNQNVKNVKNEELDESYSRSFLLDDCKDKFSFSKNTNTRSWLYTGRQWLFYKSDLESLSDVNDKLLLEADYNAMFEELDSRGEFRETLNVGVGDIIYGKNKSRVNNFYAIKIVDQKKGKVKIESILFKITNNDFLALNDLEKINYCIRNSDAQTLKWLKNDHKLNLNICGKLGKMTQTPLSQSIRNNNKEMFDLLLELGVDINQRCRGGRTALMSSVRNKNQYFFKKLIKVGADTTIKDERGKTISDYLKNAQSYDLLKLIEK